MLIAFVMMRRFGLSANLMSLGGLAIGIGMMVDGSVVMVENIFRHLAGARATGEGRGGSILHAAREVASPVFFAVLIIVVVFLPLFTLQGVEGKLFKPLAFTISFAMLGSLLVALTVVPVLSTHVLQGKLSEKESFLMRFMRRGLSWAATPRGFPMPRSSSASSRSRTGRRSDRARIWYPSWRGICRSIRVSCSTSVSRSRPVSTNCRPE